MSKYPVTSIVLSTPEITGQTVQFSWKVSPETLLYKETSFYLTFPASIPLGEVPMQLWWTVFLICIHSHWSLLRPCTIYLPVRLPTGAAEMWTRLILSYADTLDALNPKRQLPRDIKIVEQGEMIGSITSLSNSELCATAFSGGKDSLAQVGLLMEMGYQPILVTTTSPMAGDTLHTSKFRDRTMEVMQLHHGLNLVEVHSDLRQNWNNLVTRQRWGYPLSVNELSDTFLYTATLVISGYILGATNLFLASENEVSRNHVVDGVFLQHPHFMYSALTLAGISALLEPFGMRLGSLTSALQSSQVQELVVARYPDLSDLQCSCWQADESVKSCSVCGECKRLAWVSLAVGGSPARMGVDLIKMINSYSDDESDINLIELLQLYKGKVLSDKLVKSLDVFADDSNDAQKIHHPNQLVDDSFKNQIAKAISSISPEMIQSYLASQHPESLLDDTCKQVIQKFLKVQASILDKFPDQPSTPRYRPGFLNTLDGEIKEKLRVIFDDQFLAQDANVYAEEFTNLVSAIGKVTDRRCLKWSSSRFINSLLMRLPVSKGR